jgi:hypothetical protein
MSCDSTATDDEKHWMFPVRVDSHCRLPGHAPLKRRHYRDLIGTTDSVVAHRAADIDTVYGQHQNVRKTKNRNEYLEIYEVWHILRNP